MAHAYRFYSENLPTTPQQVELPTEEAHHALKVVRVREGDTIALFDGTGHEATGKIISSGRRNVTVDLTDFRTAQAWTPHLTLATAWLHKEKAIEYIIRHGTEIGINHFLFFRGHHSERPPKESPKWKRWAIETCKQCGRLDLPQFSIKKDIQAAHKTAQGQILLADMVNEPTPLSTRTNDPATIFIGPEGDFSEEERQYLIHQGATSLSLGTTTFRSEVAAILLSTLYRAHQGHLGPI